jgi:imidazolonepropionase-like amidohydrolase
MPERAARRVDWAKIRVDDFLGRATPMPPPTYAAVIAHSHAHGLPLTAHMVTLEDAKGLVTAGVDVLGHSVRDASVDDALINAMLERDVCLHPTLTRELSTYVYAERPDFFDDPFFLEETDPDVIAELERPLVEGAWADFLLLRDDPLADIRNSRSIEGVWVGGNRVR